MHLHKEIIDFILDLSMPLKHTQLDGVSTCMWSSLGNTYSFQTANVIWTQNQSNLEHDTAWSLMHHQSHLDIAIRCSLTDHKFDLDIILPIQWECVPILYWSTPAMPNHLPILSECTHCGRARTVSYIGYMIIKTEHSLLPYLLVPMKFNCRREVRQIIMLHRFFPTYNAYTHTARYTAR